MKTKFYFTLATLFLLSSCTSRNSDSKAATPFAAGNSKAVNNSVTTVDSTNTLPQTTNTALTNNVTPTAAATVTQTTSAAATEAAAQTTSSPNLFAFVPLTITGNTTPPPPTGPVISEQTVQMPLPLSDFSYIWLTNLSTTEPLEVDFTFQAQGGARITVYGGQVGNGAMQCPSVYTCKNLPQFSVIPPNTSLVVGIQSGNVDIASNTSAFISMKLKMRGDLSNVIGLGESQTLLQQGIYSLTDFSLGYAPVKIPRTIQKGNTYYTSIIPFNYTYMSLYNPTQNVANVEMSYQAYGDITMGIENGQAGNLTMQCASNKNCTLRSNYSYIAAGSQVLGGIQMGNVTAYTSPWSGVVLTTKVNTLGAAILGKGGSQQAAMSYINWDLF